jgi:hypothetical protein
MWQYALLISAAISLPLVKVVIIDHISKGEFYNNPYTRWSSILLFNGGIIPLLLITFWPDIKDWWKGNRNDG